MINTESVLSLFDLSILLQTQINYIDLVGDNG